MSDTLKHKTIPSAPTRITRANWGEEHTFAGGSDGALLIRSVAASDGAAWTTTPIIAGLTTIGTTAERITYINPTLGTISVGQTGNTQAAIAINRDMDDAAMQFGINITPEWTASGVEATGLRINNTLAAGVAKANGGGLVVEGVTMGAGSSFGAGGYFSALFRGNHEAIAAGLGTFSDATTLALETSSGQTLWIGSDKNGTAASDGIYFGVSKDTNLYRSGTSRLTTDGKLRVSGSLGVIGATNDGAAIAIGQSSGIPSSGGVSKVIYNTSQIPSTSTTSAAGYSSEPSTAAAAFTLGNYTHLNITGISLGAGSAVTEQYGLFTGPLTTAAANFGVAIGSASTATLWVANDADRTTNPYGIQWGISRDTNLYRSAAGTLKSDGQVVAATIRGAAVTYANRPATPVEGMLVTITDASTATWGATIAGGGANRVLAYYNGTNWTVAGV